MFAYWPEAAQCSRHCAVCIGLCLGRHCPPRNAPAPPPPPWGGVCPEGGISPIGPFRFLSRFMLLLPCLPLTCSLAVLLRVSFSPPPVLIMFPIALPILLHFKNHASYAGSSRVVLSAQVWNAPRHYSRHARSTELLGTARVGRSDAPPALPLLHLLTASTYQSKYA
jgi:hypothetical protein